MRRHVTLLAVLLTAAWAAGRSPAAEFDSRFADTHDRIWVGPEYWANPMEDWRVQGGRLECITPGGDRNVQLLTRQLAKGKGTIDISVVTGRLDKAEAKGSVGFRVGIHDKDIDDYRRCLIYGDGLDAGLTTDGSLFLGNRARKIDVVAPDRLREAVRLRLQAEPNEGDQNYKVTLTAEFAESRDPIAEVELKEVPAERLYGHVALVVNHKLPPNKADAARFWFNDWHVDGSKFVAADDHKFGPILWSMYTLSRGTLKMNAMMPPIGAKEAQTVRLQVNMGGQWATIAEEKIEPNSRTALFKVKDWDDTRDTPYRLAYTLVAKDGQEQEEYYTGTVRKDPVDKQTLVVAGLSCNADYAFPNREIVHNLKKQDPDLLFFAGDQIYEYVAGYGIIRFPAERAILNYLRKWWLFGLAFGDLMRDRPTVAIPDDHDVFQGNIWGNGGNAVSAADHESGGYIEPPEMVNVVHRTQTGNLPDPYDPTPIEQGITVYYTDMVYGRVGFAVIADRMFKSGPKQVATWKGRPDHVRDPNIDVAKLDRPGLELLGKRQEKFLRAWAADWKGADMKCVLSQTTFCNVADYHGGGQEYLVADLDSGGWPQTARDRALDIMRRGFALHLCGDQHLATLVHQGIERPGDANYSFCVPAIANFYPRSWTPDKEGKKPLHRPEGWLPNTGDYLDGLGNPIRVVAVGNPEPKYRAGRLQSLHDKASGYGIVRFHRDKQTMTMECWRLLADVADPGKGDQFPGWPVTIQMTDNYGREPKGHLPTLTVEGVTDPVVQVRHQGTGEVVYTLRVKGNRFRPWVFGPGPYVVEVRDTERGRARTLRGVEIPANEGAVLKVEF